jgi:DNA adenine methylase
MKTKFISPPLNWAGGKTKILNLILPELSQGKRLIEPFVGGGAVFLNSDHDKNLIGDTCCDLITFYKVLKSDPDLAYQLCKSYWEGRNEELVNSVDFKTLYYRERQYFNSTITDPLYKSAMFLWLNKHCFNGVWRVNSKGELNTPAGTWEDPKKFPEKSLVKLISKLRNTNIVYADFSFLLSKAKEGDVVYCDPPYLPLSPTSNFTSYNERPFTLDDHIRLVKMIEECRERGMKILISNSLCEESMKLYTNASEIKYYSKQRSISCDSLTRGKVGEVLAIYV